MADKEQKAKVFARIKAAADKMGVPWQSMWREASPEEIESQKRQWEQLRARLPKASREDFDRVLAKVPDRPPMKGDEWPPVKRSSRRATRTNGAPAKPRHAAATKRARRTA